jgi:hypothetical protein
MLILPTGGIINYVHEIETGVMVYIPNFMTIISDFQVILKLIPQQFESLKCWYYRWEAFIKYTIEMGSDGSGIRTRIHDDHFRHSSNIKVNTSTI